MEIFTSLYALIVYKMIANAALAEAFHYMGIVEAWGTGIPRIMNRCKEYGLEEPVFEEVGDGFQVTMFRKVSNASKKVSNESEKVSNAFEENQNTFDKYVMALKESDISERNSSNMEAVYNYCGQDTIFGQSDVMQWLECSKSKATNLMGAMKKAEIIEVVRGFGAGKYKFK